MIQDIKEKFDNQYKNCKPKDSDKVICFNDGNILLELKADNNIDYPCVKDIYSELTYLFSVGDTRYFLGDSDEFDDYKYYHFTFLRTAFPREKAFAGVTAFHLYNWYEDNKYCGRCGKKLVKSKTERALQCSCGNTVYPKICPAVIIAITNGNKLCMTKYNRPNSRWALVAGFNEIGETIEQTVHREVMEETNLKVKNLRYYKSQPWGFTSTMLYGFFCEVDGDDTIIIDNDELKAGKWFTAQEINFENDGLSLTREMIDLFKKEHLK